VTLNKAARDARMALKLTINEYKAGTVDYSIVITAQNTAYAAEKAAADVNYLRMTSAVGLVRALGGGWDASKIACSGVRDVPPA
jgi:outer membrane protein TolC